MQGSRGTVLACMLILRVAGIRRFLFEVKRFGMISGFKLNKRKC